MHSRTLGEQIFKIAPCSKSMGCLQWPVHDYWLSGGGVSMLDIGFHCEDADIEPGTKAWT